MVVQVLSAVAILEWEKSVGSLWDGDCYYSPKMKFDESKKKKRSRAMMCPSLSLSVVSEERGSCLCVRLQNVSVGMVEDGSLL